MKSQTVLIGLKMISEYAFILLLPSLDQSSVLPVKCILILTLHVT